MKRQMKMKEKQNVNPRINAKGLFLYSSLSLSSHFYCL